MNKRFSIGPSQLSAGHSLQMTGDGMHICCSQKGSIIVIVMMLLVMMSIIGIASTNTTITESFIVRNDTIRKQNLQMADSAAVEAVQVLMDAGLFDSDSLEENVINPDGDPLVWVNPVSTWDWTNWYDPDFSGRVLDTTNSTVPRSVQDNTGIGVVKILEDRREWNPVSTDPNQADNSPIRYALVGWGSAPGSSIKMTSVTRRSARVLTEYVSPDYGSIRLTVGLERDFF